MKKREMSYAFNEHPRYLKIARIMKLTIVLTLFAFLQVSARTYSQERITLKLQSAELKKVLSTIEKKSNYRFLYNDAILSNQPKVNVDVTNEEVSHVLDFILANSGIGYKILENKMIVLKPVESSQVVEPVELRVTGTVRDSAGSPIPGVSVTIKGTSTGTTTDASGNFAITVPDENARLVFSYVGFQQEEIAVSGRTTINVTLQASTRTMDQVVVVGYGTQRKLDVTGAVSTIRGEEIARQPVVNPISGLQGKVAGVQITNSGAPGASPQIRIRGLGTVYGNPNPLYVVDGVWYDDISFLAPTDIESMSILKDASSESIYGIRAANGVVLITTKKGKLGRSNVSYSGFVGYQHVTNDVKMANANQYAILANELSIANGGAQKYNPSDYGEGTDWYHQILRDALITSHNVSMSGGGEKSTYNFSIGYLKQDGLVKSNDYERYTARLQNDIQVFKPLKIGYSITGAVSKSNDLPGGIFHQLFAAAPIVPVYYADGSYGDPTDYGVSDAVNFNPQVTLDFFDQRSKNYRATGSVFADLKFAQHFTFHSSLGGEFGQAELRNYLPVFRATIKQQNSVSRLSMERAETRNWILENTLTYDNTFADDHGVKVLLGQSAQRYQFYRWTASAQNVPNNSEGDRYLRLGDNPTRVVNDEGDLSTIASYFARLNYSFKGRYLLNASIRADGSSKFFGDQRWGYFPSIGVGWVITDEPFMETQSFFNTLKLRGSWGKIGNASVPSNLSILRVTQFPSVIFGGIAYPAASISSIVPPTTFWERGVGTDIGLEAAFLDNRLNFEADYYIKKTEQAIFDIPILNSVGTSSGTIIGNQATFENSGFEFLATWKSNIGANVNYSISGNLSINDNKVLDVTTGSNPIYAGGAASTGGALATRTVVGAPIGQFYGLQVAGIFQTDAEAASSAQVNARAGDFRYVDQNSDKIIDAKDRVPIGNPNPKYFFGLNTNWTYKQFDLIVDMQGVAGVDVYNANLAIRFGAENYTEDFFNNRWHGAGTSNTYPSANIGGRDNYLPNSFFVESGSYVRLRNIQLGYTLPKALSSRWMMSNVRVFVNAQNAFNFFKYKGFSPEIGGSPTNAGIDNSVYPLYATYNFGVNVTF